MILLSLPIVAALVMSATNNTSQSKRTIHLSIQESSLVSDQNNQAEIVRDVPDYEYIIKRGEDTAEPLTADRTLNSRSKDASFEHHSTARH